MIWVKGKFYFYCILFSGVLDLGKFKSIVMAFRYCMLLLRCGLWILCNFCARNLHEQKRVEVRGSFVFLFFVFLLTGLVINSILVKSVCLC